MGSSDNAEIAALILAGGKGERLGGAVKAGLLIGGCRLLDRVRTGLGPMPLLVSNGRIPMERFSAIAGISLAADLDCDYAGPLAGLAGAVAALHASPPRLLLTVAVDTPFLPPGFGAAMIAALQPDARVVTARHNGQDYPTNALWRWSVIESLPQRLMDGTAPRSLKKLAADAGAVHLDWPEHLGGNPFANLNTIGDLIALNRRAKLEKP